MHFDSAASAAPAGDNDTPVGMMVIGGGWAFTSQTCRHVELEFHLRCVQAPALEQSSISQEMLANLRLLVVDQSLAGDILDRPEAYHALGPKASVVLGYRDVEAARRFLRQSCEIRHRKIGFLPMNSPLEVLMSCIRLLFHGEFFLPRSLITNDARSAFLAGPDEAAPPDDLEEKIDLLTRREKEVLHLVSVGGTNKTIARDLGITEHTVKLHIHNLSGKFGVANRTAAAHLYFAAQKAGHDVDR